MSQDYLTSPSGASSSFQTIFSDALRRYRDKTKDDLLTHPLTLELQQCKLPSDILAVLYEKHEIQRFIRSQDGDKTSEQWLNATFTVLTSFSSAIGESVGLVNLQRLTSESSFLIYVLCRHSHRLKRSLRESVSFS
jgi:hypothetical protein